MRHAAFVVVLLCACSEKPRPTPITDATAPPPAPELPANARAALTKPASTTPADLSVVAAQDVVRRDMEKLDAWIALGHAWIAKARASNDPAFDLNADACASVVLARNTDHADAAHLRALAHLERREFAEARQVAERMTARHPTDLRGWCDLFDAVVAIGRYEAAADASAKLLELVPGAESYGRAARLQWLNGDVVSAKQSLHSAIEAGGDAHVRARVLVQSGMVAWHEGDYDRADTSFDGALAADRDDAAALAGKGRIAMARSEWSRAVELFGRAYERAPTVETAWLLGDARAAAGDAKGADDAYALAAKDAKTDPVTYSLFLTTRRDCTKEQVAEALRLASEEHVKLVDVYTEDALSWALFRAGMVEPAKTSLGRARRLHTPDARLLFHEGAIRIAAGDAKKGRDLVIRALAMNRAFDWRAANEARALLR